jgi:anti-anti-sigma factor
MESGHITHTENISGVNILEIKGAFTKATIPKLQTICHEISERHDTKGVLLDLQEVSSIDTAAFACVINFIKKTLDLGVKVGIVNLKGQEKTLLEVLKISDIIPTFTEKSEAIAALSK